MSASDIRFMAILIYKNEFIQSAPKITFHRNRALLSSLIVYSALMPEQILKNYFGYDSFRPSQREVIDTALAGEHALVVMPTGSGKSLCFQIPALVKSGLAIVVSPLVALMEDQVSALKLAGVKAETINSSRDRETNVQTWRNVSSGEVRLLYLSPERLMTQRMTGALSNLPISLIAIDEAHCLSRWGPSFRPEYEALSHIKDIFPAVPIMALTATADGPTQDDIASKLFGGTGKRFITGFDRPNINLSVAMRGNAKQQLLDVVTTHAGQSGIVYCLSRAKTEKMAAFLCENGINALPYHAGMNANDRAKNQKSFMMDTGGIVMVATIAFGMGIDKPDVRFVCHTDMPGNMEAYYQELGRAGRDGAPAQVHMFYGLDDVRMRRMFIEQDNGDAEHKRREHKRLDALISYCEAPSCRRWALLEYFGESHSGKAGCGNCDICLNPPEMIDGTDLAQQVLQTAQHTGQSFGQAHLIDILRGADTEKIRSSNHQNVPTYGRGANLKKDQWRSLVRQLVAANFLHLDVAGYGGLSITQKGQELLEDGQSFHYRVDVLKKSTSKSKRSSARIEIDLDPGQMTLLGLLKDKRTQLAKARNVPPYLIFSDRSLQEMASKQPQNEADFADIHGVGAAKLKDLSEPFLDVIAGQSLNSTG